MIAKKGKNMKENKKEICEKLTSVLQATGNLWDLVSLEYSNSENGEIVTATFLNGATKTANVALDSGTAMILDVVEQIV